MPDQQYRVESLGGGYGNLQHYAAMQDSEWMVGEGIRVESKAVRPVFGGTSLVVLHADSMPTPASAFKPVALFPNYALPEKRFLGISAKIASPYSVYFTDIDGYDSGLSLLGRSQAAADPTFKAVSGYPVIVNGYQGVWWGAAGTERGMLWIRGYQGVYDIIYNSTPPYPNDVRPSMLANLPGRAVAIEQLAGATPTLRLSDASFMTIWGPAYDNTAGQITLDCLPDSILGIAQTANGLIVVGRDKIINVSQTGSVPPILLSYANGAGGQSLAPGYVCGTPFGPAYLSGSELFIAGSPIEAWSRIQDRLFTGRHPRGGELWPGPMFWHPLWQALCVPHGLSGYCYYYTPAEDAWWSLPMPVAGYWDRYRTLFCSVDSRETNAPGVYDYVWHDDEVDDSRSGIFEVAYGGNDYLTPPVLVTKPYCLSGIHGAEHFLRRIVLDWAAIRYETTVGQVDVSVYVYNSVTDAVNGTYVLETTPIRVGTTGTTEIACNVRGKYVAIKIAGYDGDWALNGATLYWVPAGMRRR